MFFYIFARCCLQFLKKTLITVIFWDNFWPLNLISPSEPVPYVNFTNSLSRFLVTSPGFLRDIYFSNFSYRMTEKLITLPKISELFISYRFFVLNWPSGQLSKSKMSDIFQGLFINFCNGRAYDNLTFGTFKTTFLPWGSQFSLNQMF